VTALERRRGARTLVALAWWCGASLICSGCSAAGLWTDFTSVSVGRAASGRLHRPERLPASGRGYTVPPAWRVRGNRYGTRELVRLIETSAARVRAEHRGARLGVADLSRLRGGRTTWHKSHQSGRDVDLIFYSKNSRGRSLRPPDLQMVHYGPKGLPFVPESMQESGYDESGWQDRRFDDEKNWSLVAALLSDPTVRIQWIFVSRAIKQRLLDYAAGQGRAPWLIAYAEAVMHQPGGRASPHNDHFHVRIYCSRSDRTMGCVDTGPVWKHEKKTHKYPGPERYDPNLWSVITSLPLFFMRI